LIGIVTAAVLMKGFDWKLGVFESIAATVTVSLSDFVARHSLEFAKQKSVKNRTSPTFISAMSRVILGLSLMVSSGSDEAQKIGILFAIQVIISWLYSVLFLSVLLQGLDTINAKLRATFNSISVSVNKESSASVSAEKELLPVPVILSNM